MLNIDFAVTTPRAMQITVTSTMNTSCRVAEILGEEGFDDFAVYIGEAEATALVVVGETFVVHAE